MGNKLIVIKNLLWCSLFFVSILNTKGNAAENNRIYAGTAMVDITPDSVPDSLVHDHQFIRVVAFSDGKKKALLIIQETMFTSDKLWEEMTKRIEKETGIPPEYVVLSAIHTHSSVPVGNGFNDKMMGCVKEAIANLGPAKIGAGKGVCNYNMNRRARAANGLIWLGKDPDAPCDHELSVLKVENNNGEPLSLMVNYAAHGVINWPRPKLHSGDWPGAASRFVEAVFQNKVTVPISIGASGDINPLYYAEYPFDFDTEEIEGNGMIIDANLVTGMFVGEEAVRVAKNITTYPSGKISAVQKILTLTGKKRFPTKKPNQTIESGEDLHVRLSVLKIGNIVFAGLGGEVMTEIGMHLKEQSPYKNTFVITHCNGNCGYLITDNAFKEGGYEPMVSHSTPGTEKALVENLLEMISGL